MVLTTFSSNAFAHGEDIAGPHGGFIRMPGAFHTELVLKTPTTLSIYLLDINWKNPMVKNSGVKVKFINQGKTIDLNCKPIQGHFECSAPNTVFGESGTIKITAHRLKNKGEDAVYELPLMLKK